VVLGKIPAEVLGKEVTDNGHSRKPNPVFDPTPPDPLGEVPSMSGDLRRSWTRSATILYWPLLPEPSGFFARDIVMVATKEGEEGTTIPLYMFVTLSCVLRCETVVTQGC
jgi:hypothetical protein